MPKVNLGRRQFDQAYAVYSVLRMTPQLDDLTDGAVAEHAAETLAKVFGYDEDTDAHAAASTELYLAIKAHFCLHHDSRSVVGPHATEWLHPEGS